MAKRKVKLMTAGEVLAAQQRAETEVLAERCRLEIQELQNRHHVRRDALKRVIDSATVTVQDLLDRKAGAPNVVQLKDLTKVPEHVARAVKKVKVTTRTEAGGATTQTVEVELAHHLEYDHLLFKHLGMLGGRPVAVVNVAAQPSGDPSQPQKTVLPQKLSDLPPDQVRMLRARLEKEVEALSVRDTEEAKP